MIRKLSIFKQVSIIEIADIDRGWEIKCWNEIDIFWYHFPFVADICSAYRKGKKNLLFISISLYEVDFIINTTFVIYTSYIYGLDVFLQILKVGGTYI